MRTATAVPGVAMLVLAPATPARAATPLWTWHASAPVELQRLTALGTLRPATSPTNAFWSGAWETPACAGEGEAAYAREHHPVGGRVND